jgi:hypothetical protein
MQEFGTFVRKSLYLPREKLILTANTEKPSKPLHSLPGED